MSEAPKKKRSGLAALRNAKITILRVPMNQAFSAFKKDPTEENYNSLIESVDAFFNGVNGVTEEIPSTLENVAQ